MFGASSNRCNCGKFLSGVGTACRRCKMLKRLEQARSDKNGVGVTAGDFGEAVEKQLGGSDCCTGDQYELPGSDSSFSEEHELSQEEIQGEEHENKVKERWKDVSCFRKDWWGGEEDVDSDVDSVGSEDTYESGSTGEDSDSDSEYTDEFSCGRQACEREESRRDIGVYVEQKKNDSYIQSVKRRKHCASGDICRNCRRQDMLLANGDVRQLRVSLCSVGISTISNHERTWKTFKRESIGTESVNLCKQCMELL